MKKAALILAIGAVGIVLASLVASFSNTATATTTASLAPHAPIYIYDSSHFTSQNGTTSGSGTQADPYII